VVLTEGEIDAASVYQMTGIPALSIPNGASSASKVVKDNLKYLETFKKVYVCFDNDEAGQEAATSVMNILKSGTGFRVNLTHKDANEYLLAGDANLFKSELKSAQRKTTDVILSKEEVAGLFEDSEETSDGMSTGLTELENCTEHPFLLNQGEVTSLFASASVGKSSVVRQIIANFATRGDRVLFFALEETNKRYLQKVMNMVAGRDIRYGDKLSPDEMNRLSQFAQEYILVANLVDYNWSEIEEAIEYAVRVHDVKLVVFDNITSYISSVPKTIHEAIAETMTGFVRLGKTFGHHTIVVSHTRRDSDLKEGDTPSMTHGYGGGGIERFSDNVVGLGRVQGENETKVKILKHRDNGEVGECTLTWNKNKCSFNEVKQGDKLRPVQVTTPKKETPKVEVKPVEPCLNQGTEKVVSPPTTTTTPIQVRSHKGFPSVDSVELRRTYPSSTLTGKELDP
jgi:twinkle protein